MPTDPRHSPVIGTIEPKPLDAPAHDERRKHTRLYVRKPCKIFHEQSRQYLAASTHDFSVGGAMIWLEPGRPLNVGDEIQVIVGWNSSAVVHKDSSMPASVLRSLPMDGGRQAVAVRFKVPQQLRMAA